MRGQLHLLAPDAGRPPPATDVVLSYGLGVDSTALLLRWLDEPNSRDFALRNLTIVTAMTGDERPVTGQLVTEHVLPRIAAAGVRFVQLARAGESELDGVIVLDDSTQPKELFLAGGYTLSNELRSSGTLPQVAGARRCSLKFKGFVLDRWLRAERGRRRYRQAIGFDATRWEQTRARRDATHDNATRTGWYPLQEWGWDRDRCETYIQAQTGVARWPKSACIYCPFTLTNRAGRDDALARFRADHDMAVAVLAREHHALCINPRQGLIAGRRLRDLFDHDDDRTLLDRLEQHLDGQPHAIYEVRRIARPRVDDPSRIANFSRDLRVLATGSRTDLRTRLAAEAADRGAALDTSDEVAERAWIRQRRATAPGTEHYLCIGTAGAAPKGDSHFDDWWNAAIAAEDTRERSAPKAPTDQPDPRSRT